MRRLLLCVLSASLLTVLTAGCETKTKTQTKETVTTPEGSTTTTQTHTVESSGENPPASSTGEKAK